MKNTESVDTFELVSPTPEGLRMSAIVYEKAKAEEARRVPPPSSFHLVGSNRAADQVNQRSLF
jgi:hypothetical protein